MLRVGLTGGIGSGKTTVAGRLAEHGATVIDSDRIAREVVEPGTDGLAEIVATFGSAVLAPDGSLHRAALAGVVFADPDARAKLNAIVHPLVGARSAELTAAAAPDAIVVYDVPLLVENGMAALYHVVLVVDTPIEQRVVRLVAQRGMVEADVRARIAAQADETRRRAAADVWLDNSGDRERIVADVDALWSDRLVPFEANVRLRRHILRGAPVLVPYDPTWPAQAARIIARLRLACGTLALRVDHIGSTSVPGLAAKDVLDFQVTVASFADADALKDSLGAAGFPLAPGFSQDSPHPAHADPNLWRKRMHVSADPLRWANVAIRVVGSPGWRYALEFPAWLRADDGARAEYEAVKRSMAGEFADIPTYGDAKQPWFGHAYGRMAKWAEQTEWQP
jgi:dephospho-CoA kinase